MTTTYVTFDKRSGQILSVHHGAIDAKDARAGARHHRQSEAKMDDEHIDVIPIPADALEEKKLYRVDVSRRALVAATPQEGGVNFAFGDAGRS